MADCSRTDAPHLYGSNVLNFSFWFGLFVVSEVRLLASTVARTLWLVPRLPVSLAVTAALQATCWEGISELIC